MFLRTSNKCERKSSTICVYIKLCAAAHAIMTFVPIQHNQLCLIVWFFFLVRLFSLECDRNITRFPTIYVYIPNVLFEAEINCSFFYACNAHVIGMHDLRLYNDAERVKSQLIIQFKHREDVNAHQRAACIRMHRTRISIPMCKYHIHQSYFRLNWWCKVYIANFSIGWRNEDFCTRLIWFARNTIWYKSSGTKKTKTITEWYEKCARTVYALETTPLLRVCIDRASIQPCYWNVTFDERTASKHLITRNHNEQKTLIFTFHIIFI